MKKPSNFDNAGFVLIEVLIVIAIIGVLAAIAIPHYAVTREQAQAAACLANRRAIENNEAAHFAGTGFPLLEILADYHCPNQGVYVWLVSDPKHPDYPQIACSIHFAGGTTDPSTGDTPATTADIFNDLVDAVRSLDLSEKAESKLTALLEKAKSRYEQDKIKQSERKLNDFKKQLDKLSDEIGEANADALEKKVDEISDRLAGGTR